jgi:hypothetical protein
LAFSDFTIIGRNTGAKNELVRNVEHLFGRLGGLPGSCKFNCVFNLLVEHFYGLIDIARLFHGAIVVVNVGRGDLCIVGVEMCHDFERSAGPDSNVGETEGGEIHRVDHFKDESGDGIADVDVFFEGNGFFCEDLTDVGHLRSGCIVCEERGSAGIGRTYKWLSP